MEFLTKKQKDWIYNKQIKENSLHMFPRFGFTIYTEPNYVSGEYMDTNPFTKSLDNELFLVKNKINGFYKGNFYNNPLINDFYLNEDELSKRDFIEFSLLMIISFIPLIIYNLLYKNFK